MRDASAAPAGQIRRALVERHVRRRVNLIVGGLLVAGSAIAATAPSGASTSTTNLRQKAAALATRIAADNSELNTLGETYLAARAELSRAQAAEVATATRIANVSQLVAADRSAAQTAAAAAYVDAGATTSIGLYFETQPDEIAVGETYLGYAEGQLRTSLAHLRRDEAFLRVAQATESSDAHAAHAALDAADATRHVVLTTLVSQQALLSSVNGQIATLVAEALAAKRAAEAKAAAQAAAAKAAAGLNGPPSSATTGLSSFPTGTISQDFAALRNCESGGNYADNTGNGYYGAYQFSLSTWEGLGQSGLPSAAAPGTQDAAAYSLYQRDGWGPWPACAAIIGL